MRRRDFITRIGAATAAWPLAVRAQQAGKLPIIGFLGATTPTIHGQWAAAFVQRLRELGWIETRNIAIEYRWAEGRNERYAEIASEFVRLKVDVIVTWGTASVVRRAPVPLDRSPACSETLRCAERAPSAAHAQPTAMPPHRPQG